MKTRNLNEAEGCGLPSRKKSLPRGRKFSRKLYGEHEGRRGVPGCGLYANFKAYKGFFMGRLKAPLFTYRDGSEFKI